MEAENKENINSRVLKEINMHNTTFHKTLGLQNIQISIDKTNLRHIRGHIVGSKDTPYEGQIYLFEIYLEMNFRFSKSDFYFKSITPQDNKIGVPDIHIL